MSASGTLCVTRRLRRQNRSNLLFTVKTTCKIAPALSMQRRQTRNEATVATLVEATWRLFPQSQPCQAAQAYPLLPYPRIIAARALPLVSLRRRSRRMVIACKSIANFFWGGVMMYNNVLLSRCFIAGIRWRRRGGRLATMAQHDESMQKHMFDNLNTFKALEVRAPVKLSRAESVPSWVPDGLMRLIPALRCVSHLNVCHTSLARH